MIERRTVLRTGLAGAAALAAPRVVQAQSQRVLKFIPHADLAALDPVWTTADITRNHAGMVFDQLYGLNADFSPQPQMIEGHAIENDGRQWNLTLRDGLRFHDGEPVLARDCAASILRWGKRDAFGSALMARTDEVSAPSDKVVRISLKRPFALVPDALAQYACVMMPERLARTDPNTQVTEMIGSGPFRFLANERVPGSRSVWARNADYVPRKSGIASFTAGPKVAHFDRIEWTFVPDPSTAAAALTNGEYDWWENPAIDLIELLRRNRNLVITVKNPLGSIGCLRFNHLLPPFDNAAIRRAVLDAVDQRPFMEAVAGAEPQLIKTGVGIFAVGTPMASEAGNEVITDPTDYAKSKQDLAAAGYNGEKVVMLAPSTIPTLHAQSQVAGDLLRRIGVNLDYQSLEWGTVVQRRASKEPIDKGGWNLFVTNLGGTGNVVLPANIAIRSGPNAWFGWPNAPKMEALREAWLDAPDIDAQKRIARDLQLQFWQDVPHVPLGQFSQPTSFFNYLKDVQPGWPVFHGVKRA